MNFQMFKLDSEKAEEPEIKLPTSVRSSKKLESYRKTSALLTMTKPLTVRIITNSGNFFTFNSLDCSNFEGDETLQIKKDKAKNNPKR